MASVARRRTRVVLDDPGYGVVDHAYLQGLAADLGLAGFVRARRGGGPGGTEGLWAEVEGEREAVAEFLAIVRHGAGGGLTVEDVPPLGGAEFAVLAAPPRPGPAWAAPDAGLCGPCRIELSDRSDRRFRHPFAGCTRCGPAYTLLVDPALPGGGRAATTMAPFGMCAACRAEYDDPRSRRYRSAAVCCPACGPRAAVLTPTGAVLAGELVRTAVRVLMEDQVLAVKEPGGWQLWADAGSAAGVAALRTRLGAAGLPPEAPFAALCPDLAVAAEWFDVDDGAAAALESRRRPRVLLGPRGAGRAPALAPGHREVAVGLPASGLAHLLTDALRRPVAVADVPETDPHHPGGGNDDARRRLGGVADAFVAHELAIAAPAGESLVRVTAGREVLLRRGRGHAPEPIGLPWVALRTVLGLGTDAAATPCLVHGRRAVLPPEPAVPPGPRAAATLRAAVERLRALTGVAPEVVAHDPDSVSAAAAAAYAGELGAAGLRLVAVPRAAAHVAACLADNGEWGPAIGVALGAGCAEVLAGDLPGLRPAAAVPGADVAAVVDAVLRVRAETGLAAVALSGGRFADGQLLGGVVAGLQARGCRVLTPVRVAVGAGGLAFGQAVLAAADRS